MDTEEPNTLHVQTILKQMATIASEHGIAVRGRSRHDAICLPLVRLFEAAGRLVECSVEVSLVEEEVAGEIARLTGARPCDLEPFVALFFEGVVAPLPTSTLFARQALLVAAYATYWQEEERREWPMPRAGVLLEQTSMFEEREP